MEVSEIATLIKSSKVVEKNVSELIPFEKNSRTHSGMQISQIMGSIKAFGFTSPILIGPDNRLIAGHGRLVAAEKLGLETVPCIVLEHLTENDRRALVIADNRIALNSSWDVDVLTLEIKELKLQNFDVGILGFDVAELQSFDPPKPSAKNPLEDEDIPTDVEKRCKLGEVWALGEHRLIVGDSTDSNTVLRLFDGQKSELCFTSPPYAAQREYGGGKDLSVQGLARFISAAAPLVDIFAVNLGISRKNGEINPYWDEYTKTAKDAGLKLLSWNVWDRFNACSLGQQTAMFPIEHEWIFVYGSAIKRLNRTVPNKLAGQKRGSGKNREIDGTMSGPRNEKNHDFRPLGTIVRQDVHRGDSPHPAMFPVDLPKSYIEAITQPGNIIYEPFTGSGTTFIASEATGRRCFGCEIDPSYADVAITRWEKFTGKTANKL